MNKIVALRGLTFFIKIWVNFNLQIFFNIKLKLIFIFYSKIFYLIRCARILRGKFKFEKKQEIHNFYFELKLNYRKKLFNDNKLLENSIKMLKRLENQEKISKIKFFSKFYEEKKKKKKDQTIFNYFTKKFFLIRFGKKIKTDLIYLSFYFSNIFIRKTIKIFFPMKNIKENYLFRILFEGNIFSFLSKKNQSRTLIYIRNYFFLTSR